MCISKNLGVSKHERQTSPKVIYNKIQICIDSITNIHKHTGLLGYLWLTKFDNGILADQTSSIANNKNK